MSRESDGNEGGIREAPAPGLTDREILRVVNRYIGVSGGYLGDFSYRTHEEFYREYCDLNVDPGKYEGTTRQRFIAILTSLPPADQAKVLLGVIERFPVGEGPSTRSEETKGELLRIVSRLEGTPVVTGIHPVIASEVVRRAIDDAEVLLASSGPASAVDRIHTALHGYLMGKCVEVGIEHDRSDSMVALLKRLRADHPGLARGGPRPKDIDKILNALASVLDALHPLRNQASVAHPNPHLLGDDEARLAINSGRSLLQYLDSKLSKS